MCGGSLCLRIDWAGAYSWKKFTFFAFFTSYLRATSKYKPPQGQLK